MKQQQEQEQDVTPHICLSVFTTALSFLSSYSFFTDLTEAQRMHPRFSYKRTNNTHTYSGGEGKGGS